MDDEKGIDAVEAKPTWIEKGVKIYVRDGRNLLACEIAEITGGRVWTVGGMRADFADIMPRAIVDDWEALAGAAAAVEELRCNSHGVYGLHANDDPAPWDEISEGGEFGLWLAPLDRALDVLRGVGGWPV